MTNRATIDSMAAWLMAHDDFVIMGHVSPDGDASGSTLGLWHALKALGKRAVVCLPGGLPRLYGWLHGADEVIPTGEPLPFAPQTAIAVDVSELSRLGDVGMPVFEACAARGCIDHHGTNPLFGHITLLDPDAVAAGEIVTNVIEAMGVTLTRDMAECLFVAISTDSGHFSYARTRLETLNAAARCAGAGIDIEFITTRLYRTRTLGRTRLLGLVLAGLQISDDGRMAWAFLTEAMLREANALREDNEGIVNYLREIEGVAFAVLVEERGPQTKLSIRSTDALNVADAVAVPLGGGGHPCAAGVTVNMPMQEALEKALALARAALGDGT